MAKPEDLYAQRGASRTLLPATNQIINIGEETRWSCAAAASARCAFRMSGEAGDPKAVRRLPAAPDRR